MIESGEVVTQVHRDKADGRIIINRVQDVEPILDINKSLQTEQQSRQSDFRHVGQIPLVLIEKWIMEEGAPVLGMSSHEFEKFVLRKFSEHPYLRTDSSTPRYRPGVGKL